MAIRLAFGLLLVCATALLWLPAVEAFRPGHRRGGRWSGPSSRRGCSGGSPATSRSRAWSATLDLMLYDTLEARQVLDGLRRTRDFPTSYGPLYTYLNAAALFVWNQPAAIALVVVLFEIAAVRLFVRLASRHGDGDATIARTLFIYLLNPAAFYWSGTLGYNSPVVLVFWVLALGITAGQPLRHLGRGLGRLGGGGQVPGVLMGPVWPLASRGGSPSSPDRWDPPASPDFSSPGRWAST